ncbi:hypothetical protein BH10ACI3_BH10ACI3_04620 [soil metagenome]
MKNNYLIGVRVSIILALIFFVAGGVARAQNQTVYLICTWDTSSIFKDKMGRDKFERRFYVSPTVSMTKDEFMRIDTDGERIEGLCGDYLENTVILAASERNERVDTGGQLKVIRNIELSGENLESKNMYSFATKEAVEKKRDDATKEMQDADRLILKFSWDVTKEAEADDLAAEKKRTIPTVAPKAPTKP